MNLALNRNNLTFERFELNSTLSLAEFTTRLSQELDQRPESNGDDIGFQGEVSPEGFHITRAASHPRLTPQFIAELKSSPAGTEMAIRINYPPSVLLMQTGFFVSIMMFCLMALFLPPITSLVPVSMLMVSLIVVPMGIRREGTKLRPALEQLLRDAQNREPSA